MSSGIAISAFLTSFFFFLADVVEWFDCFDLCGAANNWKDEVKRVKMPLQEGEALATWLDLGEETQKDYD